MSVVNLRDDPLGAKFGKLRCKNFDFTVSQDKRPLLGKKVLLKYTSSRGLQPCTRRAPEPTKQSITAFH